MKNSEKNCKLCSNYYTMACPLSVADLDESIIDIMEKCRNYKNKHEKDVLTILNRMEEEIKDIETYLSFIIPQGHYNWSCPKDSFHVSQDNNCNPI